MFGSVLEMPGVEELQRTRPDIRFRLPVAGLDGSLGRGVVATVPTSAPATRRLLVDPSKASHFAAMLNHGVALLALLVPYNKAMRAKITSKGQITIPAKVRRKLRLHPGQILEFDEDAPFLKAVKVFDPNAMYGTIGCCRETLGPAESVNEWLEATRGRVQLPKNTNERGD
jgi:AbrB family looped-hinge helix DNA binding protein